MCNAHTSANPTFDCHAVAAASLLDAQTLNMQIRIDECLLNSPENGKLADAWLPKRGIKKLYVVWVNRRACSWGDSKSDKKNKFEVNTSTELLDAMG